MELIKFCNAQISLIAEALLDHAFEDGNTINKIVLVMVKREPSTNKAIQTLRHFLDIPQAKVLCDELWTCTLAEPFKDFKRRGDVQRALEIVTLDDGTGYQLRMMNQANGDNQRLWFNLGNRDARALAITVIDHLRAWELGKAIRETN